MKGFVQHPFRVVCRGTWLAIELGISALNFLAMVTFAKGSREHNRIRWLRLSSRRLIRVFSVSLTATGSLPRSGFLVCNHLSYLDILVLATVTPCLFVAKREVKRWPVLGWFARRAGCLFVDREKRCDVVRLNKELHERLKAGLLVVLFPEGTSSDGQSVLPFKSSLLEPVASGHEPIYAGRIDYDIRDGDVRQEVCYWGDMTLVPHLMNLLSKQGIAAQITFSDIGVRRGDRKELARQLHRKILGLAPTRPICRTNDPLELKPA
jgi:1-acyl-sn-glycerol-3-phosphate acyltransferase